MGGGGGGGGEKERERKSQYIETGRLAKTKNSIIIFKPGNTGKVGQTEHDMVA